MAQHCKEQVLCDPFQRFVRSSISEFESFQTVSPRTCGLGTDDTAYVDNQDVVNKECESSLAQDRQPAKEGAHDDEHYTADNVRQPYGIEAILPPAALVEPIALSEAESGSAAREEAPADSDALNHSFGLLLTQFWILAYGTPSEFATFIGTRTTAGTGAIESTTEQAKRS